jgi:hypothetical protein
MHVSSSIFGKKNVARNNSKRKKIQYMKNELLNTYYLSKEAWDQTLSLQTEPAVFTYKVTDRLATSTPGAPVTLFVPWGVRPLGKPGESETQALNYISDYRKMLLKNGVPSKVLIMPADVYAIEINGYPWESTTNYFNWVWNQSENRGFQVLPWSVIRSQNQETYENILKREASLKSLWRTIPKALWYRDLLPAAYRRSQMQGDEQIKEAAFNYLRERVAEARIIELVYRPIKLSMVSPHKDDIVDCDLPRLYILPKSIRFPWMNGGNI